MQRRIVPASLIAALALGCAPRAEPRTAAGPASVSPAAGAEAPAEPVVVAPEEEPVAPGQIVLIDGAGEQRVVAVDSGLEPLVVVDRAMREHGDLGAYGDLTGGLASAAGVFTVRIRDRGERLDVDLGPLSGAGHDFSFEVVRATGELVGPVVGEVAPPPEM